MCVCVCVCARARVQSNELNRGCLGRLTSMSKAQIRVAMPVEGVIVEYKVSMGSDGYGGGCAANSQMAMVMIVQQAVRMGNTLHVKEHYVCYINGVT